VAIATEAKKLFDAKALQAECDELDEELAELRAKYEQYFLGIERSAPNRQHQDLARRIKTIKSAFVQGSGLKFKIQSLHARYLAYERLWMRTTNEMERGVYKRDLFKARLHSQERQARQKKAPPLTAGAATPGAEAQAQAPGQAPAAAQKPASPRPGPEGGAAAVARPASPPPVGSAGGLSESRIKAIFDDYVRVKRECQEDVSRVSLDSMAASLRKQVPELLKRHNAKEVDFKVIIKDGKAALRAIPK
jgi:hypothetical protein